MKNAVNTSNYSFLTGRLTFESILIAWFPTGGSELSKKATVLRQLRGEKASWFSHVFTYICSTTPNQQERMFPQKLLKHFKRKCHVPSNHWFSGDMLVFRGVGFCEIFLVICIMYASRCCSNKRRLNGMKEPHYVIMYYYRYRCIYIYIWVYDILRSIMTTIHQTCFPSTTYSHENDTPPKTNIIAKLNQQ